MPLMPYIQIGPNPAIFPSLLYPLTFYISFLGLCCFPRAAIAKYHRLGDLNNGNLFYHRSGDSKSKIKVSVGSPKASALDLQTSTFLLCPYMIFPLSVCISGISLCVHISSYKTLDRLGQGPTLMPSFYLNHFKGPVSNRITF